MSTTPPQPLSSFTWRWLAETMRLADPHATRLGQPTGAAGHEAPANATASERLLLSHAYRLAVADGTLALLQSWQQLLRLSLLAFCLLALAGGFSSALALLGDGSRAVNVVWAIGSLLGLHLLMLLLWAGNMLVSRHDAGGILGRLWLWTAGHLGGKRHRLVSTALASLSTRHGLTPWMLASVTHLLWTLALAGACLGLLAALSLRSYQFGWETTILPPVVFVAFVDGLGWLPATLGFAVPDAEVVRLSGPSLAGLPAATTAELTGAGRAWASWLLACLLLYGLLPRLVLVLACGLTLNRRLSAIRLDTHAAAWAAWMARLAPDSRAGGITDPAPASQDMPVFTHDLQAKGPPMILGLELPWPHQDLLELAREAGDITLLAPIDQRAQRQQALQQTSTQAPARLLIACNARLSPDRGSLAWMTACAARAGETRILLVDAASTDVQRLGVWRETLTQAGMPSSHVLEIPLSAQAWLKGGGSNA